jgi:hypothetical protein
MYTMPTGAPRITSGWEVVLNREDEFFVLADNKTNDGYHGYHEYQVITNKRDSVVSIEAPWLPPSVRPVLSRFGPANPRWSHDCYTLARAVEDRFESRRPGRRNHVPKYGGRPRWLPCGRFLNLRTAFDAPRTFVFGPARMISWRLGWRAAPTSIRRHFHRGC